MGKSVEEIREIFRKPINRKWIQKAREQEERIAFHARVKVDDVRTKPALDFLNRVKMWISPDKYEIFNSMFHFPVKTNEVTSEIFDKLSRVFDGRNPAFNYQFTDSEDRDDWEYYRQEVLKEPHVWATDGWDNFKDRINSILVIDLPEVQEGDKPEPYFYFIDIASVVSYETTKEDNNIMAWIMFKTQDEKLIQIDDVFYRRFKIEKNNSLTLEVESTHDLGYCPSRFFWSDSISLQEPDIKKSPLTKVLDSLDWYLYQSTAKKHLDLYGAYPIYSGYEQDCDYIANGGKERCNGHGFLIGDKGEYIADMDGQPMKCPICSSKRLSGAGSYVEIPVPSEQQPDLSDPIKMLTADVSALQYNVSEEERLKKNIITSVTGVGGEVQKETAVNEKQVQASFESQTTILNRIKRGFEEAQCFVDATVCRLRYGNTFVSCSINYGTEFYIYTPEQLAERYKVLKESGASESELDAMRTQIIETEYRHDPTQMQRLLILKEIEPYSHLTREEAINLYKENVISEEDLRIKLNLPTFVRRFERENMNIIEFGSNIDYSNKINKILETLKRYANEQTTLPGASA